jgi:heparanase 1
MWQAGNEPNLHLYFYGIGSLYRPGSYARDLPILRRMLDEEAPGTRLAAPTAYFDPREFIGDVFGFTKRVLALDEGAIDIVTWHFYPTQSENCGSGLFDRPFPSNAGNLFDEEIMEKSRRYARYVRDAAGETPVFLDETASAECGGQVGVSDTLLDALWYADWIGVVVQEGTSAILRQTLLGFDYGIVDPVSHEPRPTLLTLAAFRRFVARSRLETEVDRSLLRAHAFCNPQGANLITAVLVNPGKSRLEAEIRLNAPEILGASQWTISSPAGLTGRRATIQGESIDDAGRVPAPPGAPVRVEGGAAITAVAPESLAFAVLELRGPPAPCVD